jgi:hypothetical protein
MTKSKSQVLKEFEIEFFDIVFLNSYGGRDARPMVWKFIEKALTQQKSEIIKEIQEYWFDLVVGPKGLKDMCDKFSTYLSKLK